MKGYVYILTNPAMPGIVKVGFTSRTVHGRAGELYQTGVPMPFVVEHYVCSPDCTALERQMHEALGLSRVDAGREFFRCSAEDAWGELKRLHLEQIYEWLHAFLPDHTLTETDLFVDPADLHNACRDTDANPIELATAIEYLTPEAVNDAVGKQRERQRRYRQAYPEKGLVN